MKKIFVLALLSHFALSVSLAKEDILIRKVRNIIKMNESKISTLARKVRASIPELQDGQDYTDQELFYSSWCVEVSTGLLKVLKNEGYAPKLSYSESGHAYVILPISNKEDLIIDPTYRQFIFDQVAEAYPDKQEQVSVINSFQNVLIIESFKLHDYLRALDFTPFRNFSFGELYTLDPNKKEIEILLKLLDKFDVTDDDFIFPSSITFSI